jgi:hypothetical protein
MSSFAVEISVSSGAVSATVTPSVVVEGVSSWDDLEDKPSTFTPSAHDHDELYYPREDIDELVANLEGGQGVTDHGALTGLSDDDHAQYHNNTRGDARYYTQTQLDTSLAAKASTGSVTTVQANLDAHTGDTSDAHDASAISYAGGTGMAATDAEAAIDELANEKANASDLTAHIDDTTDAHDATAISYAGSTNLASTTVEGALDELDSEKASTGSVTTVQTNLDNHTSDTSDAHDASAISFAAAGTIASTNVQAAIEEVASEAGGSSLPCPISVIEFRAAPTASGFTLTNMAAALTEFASSPNSSRTAADLTNASEMRIVVGVTSTPGSASAQMRVQYSTDETTWNYVDGASGPAASIATASVTSRGSWVTIDAGAKADVYLRIISINGDGAADPNLRSVQVQVR